MNSAGGTTHPAVATYLAAVRDELGDLPPDELVDIAEDVRDHLEELARDLGRAATIHALTDRLGPPAAYAAELRSAAGLAEPQPEATPVERGFLRRLLGLMTALFGAMALLLAVGGLLDLLFVSSGSAEAFVAAAVSALVATGCLFLLALRSGGIAEAFGQVPGADLLAQAGWWLGERPWGAAALELITSLRPAWWVARAVAVGVIVGSFVTVPLGIVVFVAALVASVWLGRRMSAGDDGGRLRLAGVYVLNTGLAAGAVLTTAALLTQAPVYIEYTGGEVAGAVFADTMTEPITNLYAYGPDGTLLENVRLYDQNGNPFVLGAPEECYDGVTGRAHSAANPWGDNVYPRFFVGPDEMGRCVEPERRPPFGDHLPGPAPTPSSPAK